MVKVGGQVQFNVGTLTLTMPIADLLGVQFDMQLLGKLTLSVAAVLFTSWAYRFYSSREKGERPQLYIKDPPDGDGETQPPPPQNGTCRNCKMELRPQSAPGNPKHDTSDEEQQQPGLSQTSPVTDDLTPDNTTEGTGEGQQPQTDNTRELRNIEEMSASQVRSTVELDISMDGGNPLYGGEAEVKTNDSTSESTLKLPEPSESGVSSPTGRRSPCFLQRLEGSLGVGVGRELRHDLGNQGSYSTFLSKAEITVEDANLVLEGPGDQSVVRGKIYEYYVESSSHSITDPTSPLIGPQEWPHEGGLLDSSLREYGSRGSSLTEPPSSLSPIIMRDLVLPQNLAEDTFPPISPESPHTIKQGPVLLRKDSYLTAAEHHIPFLPPRASSPLSRPHSSSGASSSGDPSPLSPLSPTTDTRDCSWEGPSLETIARGRFLNMPLENQGSSELDSLEGKLDLGNCMEVLGLAKKHGHVPLQQAALRVMSDNYLQVLRDPGLYGRLMAGERDQIQRQRMRGRQYLVVADMDPRDWVGSTAQGAEQRRTCSGLYYYDDYKDTWHQLGLIPQEVTSKGSAMCTMDNYLFVAVGCKGTDRDMRPSNRVFCFNPVTTIWKEISPMNEARPHCKLAALQGHVYAIGGECLSTVERYDPRTDRWTSVAPLPNDTFAVAHRVTVCNGELFVSGGTLRYTLLRYNPKTNAWKKSLIVGSKERTTEMVAVKSFLYRFDVNPQLGVSVYRYHAVARLWYECCCKRLPRCPAFQCVAIDDTIYCVSRQFTMRFLADEISPAFVAEDLSVLSGAKGVLFPVVLSLPDKKALQTSV